MAKDTQVDDLDLARELLCGDELENDPGIHLLDDIELMRRWHRGQVNDVERDAIVGEIKASRSAKRRFFELVETGALSSEDPLSNSPTVAGVDENRDGKRRLSLITTGLLAIAATLLIAVVWKVALESSRNDEDFHAKGNDENPNAATNTGDSSNEFSRLGLFAFTNLAGNAKFRSSSDVEDPEIEKRLQSALEKSPGNQSLRLRYVIHLLGRMSRDEQQDNVTKDAELAIVLLEGCDSEPSVLVAKGVAYFYLDESKVALAQFQTVLAAEENHVPALLSAAIVCESSDDRDGARVYWKRLARLPLPPTVPREEIEKRLANQ